MLRGDDYAKPIEELCRQSRIVRLEHALRPTMRQGKLWPLSIRWRTTSSSDCTTRAPAPTSYHRTTTRADAGYVGVRSVEGTGNPPGIHTGHSSRA